MPSIQEGAPKIANMRFLQLNLNHCEAAQELLKESVRELNIDIAILSEPYIGNTTTSWASDTSGTSAIWSVSGQILRNAMTTQCGFVRATVCGIVIYSFYIPPRYDIEEFKSIIDVMTTDAAGRSSVLIVGDFNAWATEWGCRRTNERGRVLLESLAVLDVVLLNSGNRQTFNRNGRGSIIDIAFASADICGRLSWHLCDQYTHSDHSAIVIEIRDPVPSPTVISKRELTGWKCNTFDREMFGLSMGDIQLSGSPDNMAEQLISCVTRSCDASMSRRKHGINKPSVYWWNEEIAQLRKDCIKARRRYVRSRGRPDNDLHHQNLKDKKKALKMAIRRSKRLCFLGICDDLDGNPFGLAYKLVRKKLKCWSTSSPEEATTLYKIVTHLFPEQSMTTWDDNIPEAGFNFPSVTLLEVQMAVSRFQDKKAPGLDGIPNVVLKEVVRCCPDQLLKLMNCCLQRGSFPTIWKRQKLVLLPKEGKPLEDPSSYRPLCMIDTCGKLLEGIICRRLEECIDSAKGLSETQYGFRKNRSTIGAIKAVIDTAKEAIEGKIWKNGSKEYCVVVTLDVKNAFNTAKWGNIVNALSRLSIPTYLLAMVRDYFSNRVLVYDTNVGIKEHEVTGGVPQGSVLGPLLWNVMYDGVLRLSLPERVKIIGFADDIALVIVAKTVDEAKTVTEGSVCVVRTWLASMGLTLAEQKTEAVLITSRKKTEYIRLHIGGCEINTKDSLKYLGVMIDNRLSFRQHLEYVRVKAVDTCNALCRVMPNTRGPKYLRRRILAGVVGSIILYAAPIWAESGTRNKYCWTKIASVSRNAALRVCCAYRTVSDDAAFVIAGIIPTDILAREAARIWSSRGQFQSQSAINDARGSSIEEWQVRWSTSAKGRWTHTLIPDVRIWYNRRHGCVNYYITQFLSGHGCFRSYLYRFGLDSSPLCPYCVGAVEDPEHVFFFCPRFRSQRNNLERDVGTAICAGNMAQIMLSTLGNWELVCGFVRFVLIKLWEQERIRKGIV